MSSKGRSFSLSQQLPGGDRIWGGPAGLLSQAHTPPHIRFAAPGVGPDLRATAHPDTPPLHPRFLRTCPRLSTRHGCISTSPSPWNTFSSVSKACSIHPSWTRSCYLLQEALLDSPWAEIRSQPSIFSKPPNCDSCISCMIS